MSHVIFQKLFLKFWCSKIKAIFLSLTAEPFHSITRNPPISSGGPLPQPSVGYEVKAPISQGHLYGVPRPPTSNLAIGDYYR